MEAPADSPSRDSATSHSLWPSMRMSHLGCLPLSKLPMTLALAANELWPGKKPQVKTSQPKEPKENEMF